MTETKVGEKRNKKERKGGRHGRQLGRKGIKEGGNKERKR